jgi:metal iron transporter
MQRSLLLIYRLMVIRAILIDNISLCLCRILIVAAAVFFADGKGSMVPAGLFDAHQLIVNHVGSRALCLYSPIRAQADTCSTAAGIIFALALLSSGQSSSITATLSGQVVSEGFIEWRISVSVI